MRDLVQVITSLVLAEPKLAISFAGLLKSISYLLNSPMHITFNELPEDIKLLFWDRAQEIIDYSFLPVKWDNNESLETLDIWMGYSIPTTSSHLVSTSFKTTRSGRKY